MMCDFLSRTLVKGHSRAVGDLLTTGRMMQMASLDPFEFQDAPAVGEHTQAVIEEWLGDSAPQG